MALVATRLRDQPYAVSGGRDGSLRVWELADGLADGTFNGVRQSSDPRDDNPDPSEPTRSRAVTALASGSLNDGVPFIAAGGRNGSVQIWNLDTRDPIGHPLVGLECAGAAVAVGAGSTGEALAVCRIGSDLRVWDIGAMAPIGPPISLEGLVGTTVLGVTDDGVFIAATQLAAGDTTIRAWDAVSGRPIGPAVALTGGAVRAVALGAGPDGPVIAVGDGLEVLTWSATTGDRRGSWSGRCSALAFGTAGGRVLMAVGDESGQVHLLDPAARDERWEPIAACSAAVATLDLHGGLLLASSRVRRPVINSWRLDLTDREHPAEPFGTPTLHSDPLGSMARATLFDLPVLVGCGDDGRVRLWEPHGDETVPMYNGGSLFGTCEQVRALATGNVDGRPVVAVAVDDGIRVWDVDAGAQIRSRLKVDGHIVALAITRLGERPVLVVGTGNSRVHVLDLAEGTPTGAGTIAVPDYREAMAVTVVDGRGVVVCSASGWRESLSAYDLDTGEPLRLPDEQRHAQVVAVRAVQVAGAEHPLIVQAAVDGTLIVWDTAHWRSGGDESGPPAGTPTVFKAPDGLKALAVTEVDGRPHAVCSGPTGVVRIVDLDPAHAGTPAFTVNAVAMADLDGLPVLVCAQEDGIRVLALETGLQAAPSPAIGSTRRGPTAVAVADLDGSPIGLWAADQVRGWHLASGEPTGMSPVPAGQTDVLSFAVGVVGGVPTIAAGTWSRSIHFADLGTGSPTLDPLDTGLQADGVALIGVDGFDTLVYSRRGGTRARYANPDEIPTAFAAAYPYEGFETREDTPPAPPRMEPFMRNLLNRSHGYDSGSLAVGTVDGTPVVVSGHGDGQTDVFTIASALPVGPALTGHSGPITAVILADLDGRMVVVTGGHDGTVRVRDILGGSVFATVHCLASVTGLALHPRGVCVIGTQRGLVAVRLAVDKSGSDADSEQAARLRIPLDACATRACDVHDEHIAVRVVAGKTVTRMCIKGMQIHGVKANHLDYAQGHCYIVEDTMTVATADRGDWLSIPPRLYTESNDVPHAYEYDGGHFCVIADSPSTHRRLYCYRRSERDQLITLMRSMAAWRERGTR